jgi:hypothetical protein
MRKNVRLKATVAITLSGSALLQLIAAISYGFNANWRMFGLSLGGSLIMVVAFASVLLAWKIDERFDRLEELLGRRDGVEQMH